MSFGTAIKTCFKKYCVFTGRARRSEYWYWTLFNILVSIGISVLQGALSIPALLKGSGSESASLIGTVLSVIWVLAVLLPSLGVSVRRLHDTNHSGWWLLIIYVIEIAALVLLAASLATSWASLLTGDVEMPTAENMNLPCAVIGLVLLLLTFVLEIVMLVWYIKNSTAGTNKYGPNPKELPAEPAAEETAAVTE